MKDQEPEVLGTYVLSDKERVISNDGIDVLLGDVKSHAVRVIAAVRELEIEEGAEETETQNYNHASDFGKFYSDWILDFFPAFSKTWLSNDNYGGYLTDDELSESGEGIVLIDQQELELSQFKASFLRLMGDNILRFIEDIKLLLQDEKIKNIPDFGEKELRYAIYKLYEEVLKRTDREIKRVTSGFYHKKYSPMKISGPQEFHIEEYDFYLQKISDDTAEIMEILATALIATGEYKCYFTTALKKLPTFLRENHYLEPDIWPGIQEKKSKESGFLGGVMGLLRR